jgi:hypothetical protein
LISSGWTAYDEVVVPSTVMGEVANPAARGVGEYTAMMHLTSYVSAALFRRRRREEVGKMLVSGELPLT